MSDYIKITDYAAKDALLTGNPAKLVKGTELGAEFDAIAVASATKGDKSGTLAQFAATTSAQLAGVISDETGSGALVFATSPTLTTPTIGVATATSVNKVAITAPATGSTLTIADGKTLTASNTLTLAGTDSTVMTFPSTSATIARTDSAQTFTGVQSMTSPDVTTSITSPSATFALLNTTATTINAFGASTTISMGAATGTMTVNNTTLSCKAVTASGKITSTNSAAEQGLFQGYAPVTGVSSALNGAIKIGSTVQYQGVIQYEGVTNGHLYIDNTYDNPVGGILLRVRTAGTPITVGNFSSTGLAVTGAVSATTSILSSGATSGIGYKIGAGGTVTQITSRTTGVTLNTVSGAITLVSAAGTTTWQSFTVTNSAVAATDTIDINQRSGTDLYRIHVTAVAAGSFRVSFATSGGTTTEQPVFNFNVIKGVAS